MSNAMGGYNGSSDYSTGNDGNYNEYYHSEDDALGRSDDDPNDDFDPISLLKSPMFGEDRLSSRGNSDDGLGDDLGDDYVDYPTQQQQQQQQQPPSSVPGPSSSASPPPYQQTQQNNSYSSAHQQNNSYSSAHQQNNSYHSAHARTPVPPDGASNMGSYPQHQQQPPHQQQYGNMQQQNYQQMQQNMPQQMQPNMPRQMPQQMPQNIPPQMQQNMPRMQGNVMQGNMMQGGNHMGQMQGNPMHGMQGMQQMQGGMQGQYQQMGPNAQMQAQMGSMNGVANRTGSLNNAMNNLNSSLSGLNVTGPQAANSPTAYTSMHDSMPNMQGSYHQGGQRQQMTGGGGSLPTSPNPSVAQLSASLKGTRGFRSPRGQGQTPRLDANGKVIGNTSQDPGINEAMEKLCESMRRSAMSRNLVKQISSRSLSRQGSGRSLSRSNSGVGMKKQNYGRSLSGNLNGMATDDGSGRGPGTPTRVAPIRRLSDAKHRLQGRAAPGNRGAFRQNSMGSVGSAASGGRSTPKTFLQLDDQSLGAL